MPKLVVHGAQLKCNKAIPGSGSLTVVRPTASATDKATATVDDYVPMANIGSFSMCQSTSNPTVQSATAAAGGTLTPMPCVPVVSSAWSPGSSGTTIDGTKALTDDSTCSCQFGGTIEITDPASDIEVD